MNYSDTVKALYHAKQGLTGKPFTTKSGPVTTSEIVYEGHGFRNHEYWYSTFIVDTYKTDEGFPVIYTILKRPIYAVATKTGVEFHYGEDRPSTHVSKQIDEFPMDLVQSTYESKIYNAAISVAYN